LSALRRKVHQKLFQVTNDFETFEFNTIVSALMELLNEMYAARQKGAMGSNEWNEAIDIYLRMLAPITPHIAEELWSTLGRSYSIHLQAWPDYDAQAAAEEKITIAIQINGKVRQRITVPADMSQEDAKQIALTDEAVRHYLEGNEPRKIIVVPGKLINIVL
jgi:leucyl-tRNA synthetase